MRALAILGPRAREQDLAPFRAAGAEIIVAKDLPTDPQAADAALVLGGDGSVQRQLAALLQSRFPLLVVPKGSANDFARGLGLGTPADALQAWRGFLRRADNVRQIDAGVITSAGEGATRPPVYFCCVAGTGVDAAIANRANSLPGWLRARGGYFLAAIPTLMSFPARTLTLIAEDRGGRPGTTLAEAGIVVAIANAPWYGHGMRIAPQARLDDGMFDVCFVRRMGKLLLLRLFPRIYRGTHIGLPQVEYFRAARLRIESDVPMRVHADGEPAGTTPVGISVLPQALRVIV